MGWLGQEPIETIYLVWGSGADHPSDPRNDEQSMVRPAARWKELEAPSSARLRCSGAPHLPSGDCRERPLGYRALAIVAVSCSATGAFGKNIIAEKTPRLFWPHLAECVAAGPDPELSAFQISERSSKGLVRLRQPAAGSLNRRRIS